MSAYRDRLLGFGIRGPSNHTHAVPREDGPGVAGTVTEHTDGRQDATVFPHPVPLGLKP